MFVLEIISGKSQTPFVLEVISGKSQTPCLCWRSLVARARLDGCVGGHQWQEPDSMFVLEVLVERARIHANWRHCNVSFQYPLRKELDKLIRDCAQTKRLENESVSYTNLQV